LAKPFRYIKIRKVKMMVASNPVKNEAVLEKVCCTSEPAELLNHSLSLSINSPFSISWPKFILLLMYKVASANT